MTPMLKRLNDGIKFFVIGGVLPLRVIQFLDLEASHTTLEAFSKHNKARTEA